jgi:UDP-N-acetylmuramoylalanine--D-glutamate ligase
MQQYNKGKILVIGLGISGRSAAKFLLARGALVTAVDKNLKEALDKDPALKACLGKGFTALSENDPLRFDFDQVVVSPGIPPTHPLYQKAVESHLEIIGEVELACRSITQPFIGITGTNGKTTVTLLVEHVLNHCGKAAAALGNVGVPLTSELTELDESQIIVAELSSYQLETLQTPLIDAGVILNITPDHLDRYGSMEEYAQAKFQIASCMKPGAPLYIEERALKDYEHLLRDPSVLSYGYSSGCPLYTDKTNVYLNGELAYPLPPAQRSIASHDVENQMAAFALCHALGVSGDQFLEALKSFKKPPHRIEFVEKIGGVSYYDDSKGTNIDAVIRAVALFPGQVILIAGGVDKGFSYHSWVEAFGGKVKKICAIGQAAEKMERELSEELSVARFATLDEAVHDAFRMAKSGDTVLLSPGCSSFDMFRDYAHRGDEFKRIVRELKG